MNDFVNKLLGGLHLGMRKRRWDEKAAPSVVLRDMPENVLYGEDPGAIPPDEFTNQLEDDMK